MKLADYCFKHRLAPQHLQRLLGVTSRSTVTRYLTGERIPNNVNLLKIERATGGHVTLADFMDKNPPQCAAFIVDAKGNRRMVLPWSIYDKRLDRAFEAMLEEPPEGAMDPPAVKQAIGVLGARVRRRGDKFVIDKRITDTRGLVRAANEQLQRDLLPLIRYPGV